MLKPNGVIPAFLIFFKSKAREVSIMFSNNFEFKINKTQTDNEGNLLALDITI